MDKTKYEAAAAVAQEARKETWAKRAAAEEAQIKYEDAEAAAEEAHAAAASRAAGKSQREYERLTKAAEATK